MNEPLSPSDRVELLSMPNDPYPIPVGTKGIVTDVFELSGEKIYGVKWDNGRTLNLCENEDGWKKL